MVSRGDGNLLVNRFSAQRSSGSETVACPGDRVKVYKNARAWGQRKRRTTVDQIELNAVVVPLSASGDRVVVLPNFFKWV